MLTAVFKHHFAQHRMANRTGSARTQRDCGQAGEQTLRCGLTDQGLFLDEALNLTAAEHPDWIEFI